MNQFRCGARLSAITLGLLLAGCGDGQQSDLVSKMKVLMGGQSASPATATEPDPQQTRQNKLNDLLKKAEAGDVLAMVEVGRAYEEGGNWGRSPSQANTDLADSTIDTSRSAYWYEKAANLGNAEAQFRMARLMMPNDGDKDATTSHPKDAMKAIEWFSKAVEQKHVLAAYQLGTIYENGKHVTVDLVRAFDLYQLAALGNNPDAMLKLAGFLYQGKGVAQDKKESLRFLVRSAELGNVDAQYSLGNQYHDGELMPRSLELAISWWKQSAIGGNLLGMVRMAELYFFSTDEAVLIEKDNVLAYSWYNLAAVSGMPDVAKNRDVIGSLLSPVEIAEAQRLSSGWKVGVLLARESGSAGGGKQPVSPGSLAKKGTGTAFIVNAAGHAITNHHVVDGCTEVRAEGRDGVVKVVTSDVVNDLAQLQIPGAVSAQATIASDPAKLRQGEDIVVFGFPLNALLSSGGNLTPGVVSALTGLGNNTNQIQITAPIQPGSSGSPVINKKGEVVGVVAMKLSDSKMAKATGQVGQNVNFAVSGQTLKTFLDTHKVEYRSGGMFSFGSKSTADLADEARKWTLVVECWK
jgi:TPR repeat protein